MNHADKIIVCLFFLAILLWQALHQAYLFKNNKTISHWWKGVWYGCACLIITILYLVNHGWWYALKIPAIGILERMAFFDFILNAARKKPLFYNGDKTTGSWIDKLENNMDEDFIPAYKIGWVLIFILTTIAIK